MKWTVHVVTHTEHGEASVRTVAYVERQELTPASLGLAIADSKAILQGLQEVVVEWQMQESLATQRHCPQCGAPRQSKGAHHTVLRTVFGDLPITSPRFTHCPCQPQATASFSPLAMLLPERTTPELLYLETKWGLRKDSCKSGHRTRMAVLPHVMMFRLQPKLAYIST